MEVSPPMDPFDFNHARILPSLSAPSSPKRFGQFYYLSAPSSPSRFLTAEAEAEAEAHEGFAFSVSEESDNPPRSAEELFHAGKIKPLIQEEEEEEEEESVRSPLLLMAQGKKKEEERRGRDRDRDRDGRRGARSLSPYRVCDHTWEEEPNQPHTTKEEQKPHPNTPWLSSTSKTSRKWKLSDFLLFRSASEGRGSTKDPFRKFVFYKKPGDPKTSNPTPGPGPGPGPKTRRKEPLSAHELHYARKKAESEDLKKKTFLPYKQGILGRLAGFGTR